MKVRLARTAGFCMGVRRVMELALGAVHEAERPIFTYGPLIHNPQVLKLLEDKGIQALKDLPEPDSHEGGTVIIRAHGVPPQDKQQLRKAGFSKVIDGTCPRVVRVQAIIRRAAKEGRQVVIVGDAAHAEVVGLLGHAGDQGYVVSQAGQVADLPEMDQVVVVAQTTQSESVFNQVVDALQKRFSQVEVHDTICEATHRRQQEVLRLAQDNDGVVVVGGKASGNTKRLAQVAARVGKPVFLVESKSELDREGIAKLGSVAVTAGASTPNWVIKRLLRELGSIRSIKEGGLRFWLRRSFRFLVLSQLLVALGAAGMALASTLLQGLKPNWDVAGVALCYIYAMHILNQFLDKEAGQYNDPDRAHFLSKHRVFLISSGVAAASAAVVLCALLGALPFALVATMSVLGLLYSVPVVPRRLEAKIGIQRLKDIPGSKTLAASLAWAFIVALLPAAALGPNSLVGLALAFTYTLVLMFLRSALFDVLDVQGDLIVGKETIPIVLGEAQTRRLLLWLTWSLAGAVVLAALWGGLPGLAWWLLLPVLGMAAMQLLWARSWITPGSLSEGLVDLNFWLAGAVALAWLTF
jgi:(E)-4-hydroxy-3-methyl-but-2-enyl pyrophosphate reductase